jgi:NAD(P)-dependent dehydrogenase (short-subunit alcohol dehydrogenase family)
VETLDGKVAVVTGAASGIGRALAERFVAEGMKVVLADVEAGALERAEADLAGIGGDVCSMVTDVADRGSVNRLAAGAIDRFGPPHVLCNNAGVTGGGGPLWETSSNDWAWVLGVNLMGVVHGIQAFVPAMIAAGHEGHIVNTSSVLGLSTGGGSIYGVTKHAVTRLTEGLWYDLRAAGSSLSASVLCPGLIATHIVTAGRNRPSRLTDDADVRRRAAAASLIEATEKHFLEAGMPPEEVAAMVDDAIHQDRFYVLTHPEMILEAVQARFEGILDGQAPPPPRPLDLTGGAAR